MTGVRDAFRTQSWRTRVHVAIREASAPLAQLEAALPRSGAVLDWGCGHGVLALRLALASPDLRVEGTDIDPAKVASAAAAARAAGLSARASFIVVDTEDVPSGTWDGIVVNDVLYLLRPEAQEALVRDAAASLAPGGTLVCKEVGRTPRWKATLTRVQERISVGVLRITASGHGLHHFPDPQVVASWMDAAGLDVEVRPVGHRSHVPHVAVIGRRSESGPRGRG